MSDKKLSLAMIVKNCDDHLEKTINSLPYDFVDEICIVDTGSSDKTPEIAKRLSTKFDTYTDPDPVVIDGKEYLSDFSVPRNKSFDMCSGRYILWLDSDDIFWYSPKFAHYWNDVVFASDIEGIYMTYDYNHNNRGDCISRQGRERIVKQGTHVWRSPIHEVLCAFTEFRADVIDEDIARIIHDYHPDEDKNLKARRNAAVAKKFIDRMDGNVEARMWLNYANSLHCIGNYEEAISCFSRYLHMSDWQEERYSAFISCSDSYRNMGEIDKAFENSLSAIKVCPKFREAYIELATNYLQSGEYGNALHWIDHALTVEENNMAYRGNPYFINARPYEIKLYCYIQLQRFKEAIEAADFLLDKFPGNHKVLADKTFASHMLRETEIADSYKHVERALIHEGSQSKHDMLKQAVPSMLHDRPDISRPVEIPRKPGAHSLCLYCGQGLRTWGHDSIEKGGVGGSETAAIRMAEELVGLGWHVEIYGYPSKAQEGQHNGVWWLPHWRMSRDSRFDVFVNWRSPKSSIHPPKSNVSYVWLHDVQNKFNWPEVAIDFYDAVIPLSNAHRENVSFIPDEKIWISRNGLDPSFWEGHDVERVEHNFVYASCPSRGLHILLPMWPKILEAFPGATLDIFYGFNDHFKEKMKTSEAFKNVYATVMRLVQLPGITFHGMVDQTTLGRAFAKADIWAYPCSFPEISCITAMQAQAAGAIPVTTGYWALSETVRHGVVVGGPEDQIDGNKELCDQWLEALLEESGLPRAEKESKRLEMMPWARTYFPWMEVAKEWDQKFRSDLTTHKAMQRLHPSLSS